MNNTDVQEFLSGAGTKTKTFDQVFHKDIKLIILLSAAFQQEHVTSNWGLLGFQSDSFSSGANIAWAS